MKQIIIMAAMIGLGIAIFNLIAGSESDSIKSIMGEVWEEEIKMRTSFP